MFLWEIDDLEGLDKHLLIFAIVIINYSSSNNVVKLHLKFWWLDFYWLFKWKRQPRYYHVLTSRTNISQLIEQGGPLTERLHYYNKDSHSAEWSFPICMCAKIPSRTNISQLIEQAGPLTERLLLEEGQPLSWMKIEWNGVQFSKFYMWTWELIGCHAHQRWCWHWSCIQFWIGLTSLTH